MANCKYIYFIPIVVLFLNSCVVIPIPPVGNLNLDVLDKLENGKTSRVEVNEFLGPPVHDINQGQHQLHIGTVYDYGILWAVGDGAGYHKIGSEYYLIYTVYDNEGVLKSHIIYHFTEEQLNRHSKGSLLSPYIKLVEQDYFLSIAFSPDGSNLMALGSRLYYWDISNDLPTLIYERDTPYDARSNKNSVIHFTPNGKELLVTGYQIYTNRFHEFAVSNGKHLKAYSIDKKTRKKMLPSKTKLSPGKTPISLIISPNGNLVTVKSKEYMITYSRNNMEEFSELDLPRQARGPGTGFTSDNNWLIFSDEIDGKRKIMVTEAREQRSTYETGIKLINDFRVNTNFENKELEEGYFSGNFTLSANGDLLAVDNGIHLEIWNVLSSNGDTDKREPVVFQFNKLIRVATNIKIFEDLGRSTHNMWNPIKPDKILFFKDGRLIIKTNGNNIINAWNIDSGKEEWQINIEYKGWFSRGITITDFSLSPDGSKIAVATPKGVWLYSIPESSKLALH